MRDPKFRPPMARVAPRDGPGEFPAPDFNMLHQIDASRSAPHAPGARRGRPECEKAPKMPPNASILPKFSLQIVAATGFLGVGVAPAVFIHV